MVEYSGRHWWMDYERADLEGVKETAITVGVTPARICPGI